MTAEISQEAQTRMVALIRDYVAACAHCTVGGQFLTEARAIVAMLPVPVDPLLVEARALCLEVVADIEDAGGLKASFDYWYQTYHSGACDKHKDVQRIYARLRELAKARAGEGSV